MVYFKSLLCHALFFFAMMSLGCSGPKYHPWVPQQEIRDEQFSKVEIFIQGQLNGPEPIALETPSDIEIEIILEFKENQTLEEINRLKSEPSIYLAFLADKDGMLEVSRGVAEYVKRKGSQHFTFSASLNLPNSVGKLLLEVSALETSPVIDSEDSSRKAKSITPIGRQTVILKSKNMGSHGAKEEKVTSGDGI